MTLFDPDLHADPHNRGSLYERFIAKLGRQDKNGCLLWAGATDGKESRGNIVYNGKLVKAPRVAYFIANGPFDKDLHILHSCDNPNCVEPSHLRTGTHQDNIRDRVERGRSSGGSLKGENHGISKLTEAQVLAIYRRAWAGEKQADLAAEFGISISRVSAIKLGKDWAWLTGHNSRSESGLSLTPAT